MVEERLRSHTMANGAREDDAALLCFSRRDLPSRQSEDPKGEAIDLLVLVYCRKDNRVSVSQTR
jgi:hypothetical protein